MTANERINTLWPNQQEALRFSLENPAVMLDMDMGTGKTRVTIENIMARCPRTVLVLCPKAVIPTWPRELKKHGPYKTPYRVWTAAGKTTVAKKANDIIQFLRSDREHPDEIQIFVMNYDIVWRNDMRPAIERMNPEMVVLDESHRAKTAGSKVSKYLAMIGKRSKYRLCLSGTPMANSPLDVYGQYRFLDPKIFGTRFDLFRDEYAILGGPEKNFVVGFKNQDRLMQKFRTIAYSCKMDDIRDRLKLPERLPHQVIEVDLPPHDMKISKKLAKEFIAEVEHGSSEGAIVLKNVLNKLLRLQQIASGYVPVQEGLLGPTVISELNTAKEDAVYDLLNDMPEKARVVVFVVFRHDVDAVRRSVLKAKRGAYELSGEAKEIDEWNADENGGVLVTQINAGAEGVDLTSANICIYYNLPMSVALYEQSMARLYRPGQSKPVLFIHLVARDTIDQDMLNSINAKRSLFQDFINGNREYGFIR